MLLPLVIHFFAPAAWSPLGTGVRSSTPAARAHAPRLVLADKSETRNPFPDQEAASLLLAAGDGRGGASLSKGVVGRTKGALNSYFISTSDQLWRDVFSECDGNNDGGIDRRELLVLLYRLGVDIPSTDKIKELFLKYDIDENGTLEFTEFSQLVRDLDSSNYVPGWRLEGVRSATRRWFAERRQIVLWRTLFDRFDALPRDGYLQIDELATALRLAGIAVTDEQIRFQVKKYDANGDARLDFEEFKRFATDLISSSVQYSRAVRETGGRLGAYQRATERAQAANEQAEAQSYRNRGGGARDGPVGSQVDDEEARRWAAAELSDIKKRIDRETFTDALSVLRTQDDLYRRFKVLYGSSTCSEYCIELNDVLTAERVLLLDAIKEGDVDTIRALTNIDWNFVYPPAYVNATTGARELEAWCRTPLCLLVRPDEGNFQRSMVGVSERERLELIEDVLASGCADPNFPLVYWGGPAPHACFEGDLAALDALRIAGCDLSQKFEWLLQDGPLFSLVHAAAFNGQVAVLKYLRNYLPPSFFREVDAEGSNPLHTLLESSRDMDTARFLLEVGVDGFAVNKMGRSPLSMAIESLPELALELLSTKSRFEYRWWGNDLYWFSFSGVILNGTTASAQIGAHGAAAAQAGALATANGGVMGSAENGRRMRPLGFRDQNGQEATIEELIVRHERKELLETPVMLDLIERKWLYFAGDLYRNRFLTFAAMLLSVFAVSALDEGTPFFYVAAVATAVTWPIYLKDEISQIASKISGEPAPETPGGSLLGLKLIDVVDLYNLVLVPVVLGYRILDVFFFDVILEQFTPGTTEALAGAAGLLQVTLAISMLRLVAQFRVLGPLLITVYQMVSDALQFAVVLGIVVIGFANGFYSLIHFGVSETYLASLDFDYSYPSIVQNMCLWLTGQPDLTLVQPLSPGVQLSAEVLFWSFIVTSYFVLLNLLIAIFNTTYERVLTNSQAEWLYVRLRTTLEFEGADTPGVRQYYDQLRARDNQRAVRGKDAAVMAEADTDFLPAWARNIGKDKNGKQ